MFTRYVCTFLLVYNIQSYDLLWACMFFICQPLIVSSNMLFLVFKQSLGIWDCSTRTHQVPSIKTSPWSRHCGNRSKSMRRHHCHWTWENCMRCAGLPNASSHTRRCQQQSSWSNKQVHQSQCLCIIHLMEHHCRHAWPSMSLIQTSSSSDQPSAQMSTSSRGCFTSTAKVPPRQCLRDRCRCKTKQQTAILSHHASYGSYQANMVTEAYKSYIKCMTEQWDLHATTGTEASSGF